MMLRDISIRTRLLVLALALSLGMLLLGGLGVWAGKRALAGIEQIYARDMHAVELLYTIKVRMLDTAADSGLLLNATTEAEKREFVRQGTDNLRVARESWRAYREIPAADGVRELSARFQSNFEQASVLVERNLHASAEQDMDALARTNEQIAPVWDVYANASEQLAAAQRAQSRRRYEDTVAFFDRFVLLVGAVLALGLGLAIGLYRNFMRTVIGPLDGAVSRCERIADGDLSDSVAAAPGGRDEVGRMMAAFSNMQANLRQTVATVQQSAGEIGTATREIAAGTVNLSQRTESQAASLQETSASMRVLTETVKTNADDARAAMDLTRDAAAVARHSQAMVDEVVQTMERIRHSARQVEDIVGMIEGIAFQTNILALNAAVEAARAGEQGRGFAVVAGEVRQLAQRSSGAAREISQLIRSSGENVNAGTTLVGQAGQTIAGMSGAIAEVEMLVARIAEVSRTQSADIGQVGQAVADIDQATQQNAALVEQATAAAHMLAEQMASLGRAVAVFRTGEMAVLEVDY